MVDGEKYIENLKEFLKPLKIRILTSYCKGQNLFGKETVCDLLMGKFTEESDYEGFRFSITRFENYTEVKLWTEKVKPVIGKFSSSGKTSDKFNKLPEVLRIKANDLFDYIKQFKGHA